MEERGDTEWLSISDRALVDALRSGDVQAVDELIRRFEPLVARYAQLLGVAPSERGHWIGELLYEVAMTLGRGRAEPPRHLGAYVAGACKLKARQQRATESTYHRHIDAAADALASTNEAAVLSLCSESVLRSARGPASDDIVLPPVLERLAGAFSEAITEDERLILDWLASQISYTTIATWLGISRPAAVSRIQRLRLRLIRAALGFGVSLERAERAELVRFLRRTGTVSDEQLRDVEQAASSAESEEGDDDVP